MNLTSLKKKTAIASAVALAMCSAVVFPKNTDIKPLTTSISVNAASPQFETLNIFYYVEANPFLYVRSSANANVEINKIGSLYNHSKVTLKGSAFYANGRRWVAINYNGRTGYVATQYLRKGTYKLYVNGTKSYSYSNIAF